MPFIKRPKIKCTSQEIDQLMSIYKVTRSTVYNSLNFRNLNSDVSKSIRAHAEKIFGHEVFYEEITV